MTSAAEWLARLPQPVMDAAVAFAMATITGVLAVAFMLGGFWALRGRAALRMPACRRCLALLRGSGVDVPTRCSECGADLEQPFAVLWLRFRRQPATVLLTAPVVLLGGTSLAVVAAAFLLSPVLTARRLGKAVEISKNVQSAPIGSPVQEPEPTALESIHAMSAMSIPNLLEAVRSGGEPGTAGLVLLVERIGIQADTDAGITDAEVDATLALIRDLALGKAPHQPFITPARNSDVGDRAETAALTGWRTAALRTLAVIRYDRPQHAAMIELLARQLLPRTEMWHPKRVAPMSPIEVRVKVLTDPGAVVSRITRVRIDGEERWPTESLEMGTEFVVLLAPPDEGEHLLEVTWVDEVPMDGDTVPSLSPVHEQLCRIERSRATHITVAKGNERLDPVDRAGGQDRDLIELVAVSSSVSVNSSKDLVYFFVVPTGPLAFEGRWEIEAGADGWRTVGEQRASDGDSVTFPWLAPSALTAGPSIRMRYTPAASLDRVTLPDQAYFGPLIAVTGRSWQGVLATPRVFELVSAQSAQGSRPPRPGSPRWNRYSLRRDGWTAPSAPSAD